MENSIEGNTDIVELDESLFGKKRKYNRGAPTKRIWIFGLVERATRKTVFVPVNDRKKETLIPIIQKHVRRGSKIFHDDWAAYAKLEQHGYVHDTVVHAREFVSPTGVCTNTIEGKFQDILHILLHFSFII